MTKKNILKLLMIEDDEAQSLMYKIEFKNFGMDLEIINDGEGVYDKIVKMKPDLILLDLLIGRVSGLDVLKEIKAKVETKDIKVIIMSNYNKKGLSEECIKSGAMDYWVKSDYVPRQIVEKVRVIIN